MVLANLPEMNFSPYLVNQFYSRIVIKESEYDNVVLYDEDVIYTFFYGKKRILTKQNLGKLLKCEHYNSPHKVPLHYLYDNVWQTLSRPDST